jgi:hypothetical protein
MSNLRQLLVVVGLALAGGSAQAQVAPAGHAPGAYLVLAGGANQYDYDCWFWSDCETVRSDVGKIGGGYRFGIFGVEAWHIDFGRARINRGIDRLHMRATGIGVVWYASFGPQIEGLLRTGAADVWHWRSDDTSRRTFNGTFGLGLVFHMAPAVALEVAWDVTGGEGENTGSSVASAITAGIRVKF